jgi:hypothetical protein
LILEGRRAFAGGTIGLQLDGNRNLSLKQEERAGAFDVDHAEVSPKLIEISC